MFENKSKQMCMAKPGSLMKSMWTPKVIPYTPKAHPKRPQDAWKQAFVFDEMQISNAAFIGDFGELVVVFFN